MNSGPSRTFVLTSLVLCLSFIIISVPVVGEEKGATYSPQLAPASDEGLKAIQQFTPAKGLKVDLVAAEPMLANPVGFCIDNRGRFFVAETFRLYAGVTDNRQHMYWLEDDLAARTVQDRVALYRKHLGEKLSTYDVDHDRVRLLVDRNGDGKVDHSSVFADGFNALEDGIGSSVIARGNKVWFTCIPHLWQLEDNNNDGRAETRKSLHSGFGVHVSFIGHDLHGLRFGPDGRLYFSIGDRGYNIPTKNGTLAAPDTGAVFRCNPDGSELEVFATGLRNPQELAFDQYGNLFTCDNNSDSGDKARWVYLVEGGDSGWQIGYQYAKTPVLRGPWNSEKLWYPHPENQAAYVLPPIAHLSDGPSGLTYHPGVAQLPDKYKDHFFLTDFRGAAPISGIHAFQVKPKGASFELGKPERFMWGTVSTDVDFGPDGGLYFTDWVHGWRGTGKGRIYRISDPTMATNSQVLEVKDILAKGMGGRSLEELARFLEHADIRVRQEAQFALAEKGRVGLPLLQAAAEGRTPGSHSFIPARLHGIWGIGQIGRMDPSELIPLMALLRDPEPEVRAQAARTLGEGDFEHAYANILHLLLDPSLRVRFFAAQALGRLTPTQESDRVADALLYVLRENKDQDVYLRHACVVALARLGNIEFLKEHVQDESPSARMGILLAMRRLKEPAISQFLSDSDHRLILEAARAIYDVPIDSELPKLAALAEQFAAFSQSDIVEPLFLRVLNANFRLGSRDHAEAVTRIATHPDASRILRLEAIQQLTSWAAPSNLDRLLSLWRPSPSRPTETIVPILRANAKKFLSGPATIRQEAAKLMGRFEIKESGPHLLQQVLDKNLDAGSRIEALDALERLKDPNLSKAVHTTLDADSANLRAEARRILASLEPENAVGIFENVLQTGTTIEKQSALTVLAKVDSPDVDKLLLDWLEELSSDRIAPELKLELLDAASARAAADVKDKLDRYRKALNGDDVLANNQELLYGGDAWAGRKIFFEKTEVACLRCHRIGNRGGEVGPELSKIAAQHGREYLLEALIAPNKQIAKGYETLVVATEDGLTHFGIVKADNEKSIQLMNAEGDMIIIPKKDIVDQNRGQSSMPDDVTKHLTKREIRDLVEYLAGLK